MRVRSLAALHSHDNHGRDGLRTGLAEVSPEVWRRADRPPSDVDVVSVHDDLSVMVLVQLADRQAPTPGVWGRLADLARLA